MFAGIKCPRLQLSRSISINQTLNFCWKNMLLSPVIHVIYGSLWIVWLKALRKPVIQTTDTSLPQNTKCASVRPCLAIFLYIVAWVQLVACILTFCLLASSTVMQTHQITPLLLVGMALLSGIFVLQIVYIRDIWNSERTITDDCTTADNQTYRQLAYGFAVFLIVIGVAGILGLMVMYNTTKDNLHPLTQHDMASLLQDKIPNLSISPPARPSQVIKRGKRHRAKM
jgi:cytochrome b561